MFAGAILLAPAWAARWLGLAGAGLHLGGAALIWYTDRVLTRAGAGAASQGWSVETRVSWFSLKLGPLGQLQVDWWLGVDGLSGPLVLLSGLVGLVGVVAAWSSAAATTDRPRGFFSLYLLLLTAVTGCFVAVDGLLFYVFFEVMLLPMYFLIGIWGGARRELAAVKFFLYTLVGSLLILLVFVALYPAVIDAPATIAALGRALPEGIPAALRAGTLAPADVVHSFNLPALTAFDTYAPGQWLTPTGTGVASKARLWAFGLLLLGFGIKLPVVPLHTWLPDAHVEAPTPISVVLAGLLLKVGAYGLLRFTWPIFPDAARALAGVAAGLGAVSILYGALCALAQTDLKKLIAYSSVSHMGFVLLGLASLTAEGTAGAVFQLFSHGLLSPLLFLVAGVLYDRTHSRQIAHFRGLAGPLPRFAAVAVMGFFGALGLPGFSGFIAEILVLLGAWKAALMPASLLTVAPALPLWTAVLPLGGLLVGAGYCLWTVQRLLFGSYWVSPTLTPSLTPALNLGAGALPDLTRRERWLLGSLAAATLGLGLFPAVLLDGISPAAAAWVHSITTALVRP